MDQLIIDDFRPMLAMVCYLTSYFLFNITNARNGVLSTEDSILLTYLWHVGFCVKLLKSVIVFCHKAQKQNKQ